MNHMIVITSYSIHYTKLYEKSDANVCTILPNNSFGAVSPTSFQTTSTVTFSGSKDVYLACKGQVLLQPNTQDPTKVNLILKPFEQPIKGLPIKYIIYRGLMKSDFVNSGGILEGSETTGTEFVQFLWKEFNQFYSSENTNQPAPAFDVSFIGFPSTTNPQTDTTKLIDTRNNFV